MLRLDEALTFVNVDYVKVRQSTHLKHIHNAQSTYAQSTEQSIADTKHTENTPQKRVAGDETISGASEGDNDTPVSHALCVCPVVAYSLS